MGKKRSCGHKNGRETSPVEVCHGGPCCLIRVDIFVAYDKIYLAGVRGIGKSSAGNLFASYFLWKIEKSPSSFRRSKYVSCKEIRDGIAETRDISIREINQFATCKLRDDWFSHRKEGVFNLRPNSGG